MRKEVYVIETGGLHWQLENLESEIRKLVVRILSYPARLMLNLWEREHRLSQETCLRRSCQGPISVA